MITSDFQQRCEGISIKCRYQLGLKAYEPLAAHVLAKSMGVMFYHPDELPDMDGADILRAVLSKKWSAITVTGEPAIVIYHPDLSIEDFEWNMMHELAHLLLKHQSDSIGNLDKSGNYRQYCKQKESEADFLADCLKIPRPALSYASQARLTETQIIHYFKISLELLKRRLSLYLSVLPDYQLG